jgi:RNA polymerase sigma-70 factor (ECF subfamily)
MKGLKSLSDEKLVHLVCHKDKELYQELVHRYEEKLLRYAVYLVRDEDKAADVVQEAFIKAFVNLRGFNIKKKFSSWIYRIVHNQAINYLKKHKKEISLENNEWIKELLKSNQNIEKDFDKDEAKKMTNVCLKELPLLYRSPLALFYLEERSYEEISDVLRIPIGTVGTRINRGKKLMKVICKKKGGEIYV